MASFTVYPAIDLHQGEVVRLRQGDLTEKTVFASDASEVAKRWLEAGAEWLHVVNLDGAFGKIELANLDALKAVLATDARVQFGGGLRSLSAIGLALSMGVHRAVLGTMAVEKPEIVRAAVRRFGAERIAIGIDSRSENVHVRGWSTATSISPLELGKRLRDDGITTIVYTDINRDGMGEGLNIESTKQFAQVSGLSVIASGGVASVEDVVRARQEGLSGVIIGRALYEGQIVLQEALEC